MTSAAPGAARVFIEVPPSESVLSLVQFAAEVARSFDARLEGRFTQNQALMDLADLPFASEVSFSGAVRALDSTRLHREWEAQAKRAQTLFSEAANVADIEWQFEVTRGKPLYALGEAAAPGDVVVLQAPDRTVSQGDIARAAQRVVAGTQASVLVVGRYGVGETRRERGACLSLCPDEAESRSHKISSDLADRLGVPNLTVSPEESGAEILPGRVRETACGLLVADASLDLFAGDAGLETLATEFGCPLLLVSSAP